MTRLTAWEVACIAIALSAATAIAATAHTFTTLVNFDGRDGAFPDHVSLVQGPDGNLYGTTENGGNLSCQAPYGCGTVFKVTSAGILERLSFSFNDGSFPTAGLVLSTDGNFYGTTLLGGTMGDCNQSGSCGTFFKVTPAGRLTTLHSFCSQNPPFCTDGVEPFAGLAQSTDGNFYGTTSGGGSTDAGTVFKVTSGGMLTTIYNFCSQANCTDGLDPYGGGLVQGSDGNLYGTSEAGGAPTCLDSTIDCGTVFRITSAGTLTTLHTFGGTDGAFPFATLVEATDGNFYGTTYSGGNLACDPPEGCGTVFKIAPGGTLTTLHAFDGSDGVGPTGALVLATDGNFYGTTTGVGNTQVFDDGTVFKMTAQGVLTTLHSFNNTDGANLTGGLLQATDGKFYGTTHDGGNTMCARTRGCGTIFSLDMGLGPFLAFVGGYGRVGRTFAILGQGFTGTTSVMLNGTPATFKVKSDTLLGAAVPAGATTGYVTVTTPSGILTSNVPFHVIR